jgi:preprotein translocase subunit Sec61beta
MAKQQKNAGFQQSAGLIRYFDAEEETAIHIDPRIVIVTAFAVAIIVLAVAILVPLR